MNRERLKRAIRFYRYKLFPRNQATVPVAISIFLGVWIGVMPTIGIAIALTVLICKIFRLPIVPGVTSSFIANPATQFPIFYPVGYWIGLSIVNPAPFEFLSIFERISKNFAPFDLNSYGDTLSSFASLATENTPHFFSFLLGMTILSTVIAGICFFLSVYYMDTLKKNRKERKEAKRLAKKSRKSV